MPLLRTFLEDTLLARGPSTVDELADAARAAGATRARHPLDVVRSALRQADLAIPLPDGRWSCAAWILDDVVLTHRVRAPTAGRRDLWPRNDLFPYLPMLGPGMSLASGGALTLAEGHRPNSPVLTGPPGWLPSVEAGALLALHWRDGALRVAPVDVEPDRVTDRVISLRDAFAYHRDANTLVRWQSPLTSAMLASLLEVPGLLGRALPPLGEILSDLLRAPDPRQPRSRCCCTPEFDPRPPQDDSEVVPPPDVPADHPVIRPLFP